MKILYYLTCMFLVFREAVAAQPSAFYSQASQDAFVYTLLYCMENEDDDRYYLEIGAADPIITSNTYFFEKKLDWKGVSIEIDSRYQKAWTKERSNSLIVNDATKINYSLLLQSFPRVIDYLSLDVDECYDVVLNQIPFDQHIFKIITIEHDFYRFGSKYRDAEREILTSLGYYLLCPDVSYPHVGSFEDWWIHPIGFSEETFKKLMALDLKEKYHDEIILILLSIKPEFLH